MLNRAGPEQFTIPLTPEESSRFAITTVCDYKLLKTQNPHSNLDATRMACEDHDAFAEAPLG